MKRYLVGFSLWCFVLLTVSGEELAGARDKWRYLRSPHFEVYSAGPAREAREILQSFELLRAYFLDSLGFRETRPVPLTVYYFSGEKAFKSYVPESGKHIRWSSGWYVPGRVRSWVIMQEVSAGDTPERAAFSHLTSHLTDSAGVNLPFWTMAGLRQVLSSTRRSGDQLVLGAPPPDTLDVLGEGEPITLEFLFTMQYVDQRLARERRGRQVFATSWAFLHYLFFDQKTFAPGTGQKVLKALSNRRILSADATFALLQEATGKSRQDLDQGFRAYLRKVTFATVKVDRPQIAAAKTYLQRDMSREEVEARLAELGSVVSKDRVANRWMLDREQEDPADPLYWEALGETADADNDVRVAIDCYQKSLERGSVSATVQRRVLELRLEPTLTQYSPSRRFEPELIADFRQHLDRLERLNPTEPSLPTFRAWVEAYSSAPESQRLQWVEANLTLATNPDSTALALATAYWRLGDLPSARKWVKFLEEQGRDASARRGAEILLRILE